jgi:transcriptional regulator with XRE-family HTH domain
MEGDLQRVLGQNLRSYRQGQQLSQEALADVLEVHRTYLGAIERGEKNVSLRSLERLAGRLGLPPLQLLATPESTQPPRGRAGRAKSVRAGEDG